MPNNRKQKDKWTDVWLVVYRQVKLFYNWNANTKTETKDEIWKRRRKTKR